MVSSVAAGMAVAIVAVAIASVASATATATVVTTGARATAAAHAGILWHHFFFLAARSAERVRSFFFVVHAMMSKGSGTDRDSGQESIIAARRIVRCRFSSAGNHLTNVYISKKISNII